MENKNNIRAMLILIEMYQKVQKYYEIDKSLTELESDFKEFKKHKNNIFNFKGNEEMKELFDSISNNLERNIKNLKENGIK